MIINNWNFSENIKCGNSRRKVEDIHLKITDFTHQDDDRWSCQAICTGAINTDKVIDGRSMFDCLVLAMAFLRQSLRYFKEQNSKVKFFEVFEEELNEITIDDVFWTHDCVSDEVEAMVEWALENGYKPEE